MLHNNVPSNGYSLRNITQYMSGLHAYKIKLLEYILRSAARVVHNIPHCEKYNDISITLIMTKLNWLSVANRIKYKLCIYIHSQSTTTILAIFLYVLN